MKVLKRLELDENVDIDYVEEIISEYNVQLEFKNLDVFKKSFNKFYSILWDYAERVKSLSLPREGNIFEDSVTILSEIEDKLEISISHVVINSEYHEDIKQLIDFYYYDLQDGSLNIAIEISDYNRCELFKSPVEIIAYIERGSLHGVSLCMDFNGDGGSPCYLWEVNAYLFDSVIPYTSIVYCNDTLNCEFDGFVVIE